VENMSSYISNITSIKANSINEIPKSSISSQDQLYSDLQVAVNKHYRYLHGLAETKYVCPPKWYLVTKRVMDVCVGILGLIMLSPLFLVLSFLIKLSSPGPIYFSQLRVGKKGKLFKMYKFRTMVADAEKKTGPVWATKNDPRVTEIGRFLRKSKMDELPQLLNLVRGEMSMVGPRPERPFFVDQFSKIVPGYTYRLEVTPGLTGPAQLRNGYDSSAMDVIRKLRYDASYVKKIRLSMDIGLIASTFMSVLSGKL